MSDNEREKRCRPKRVLRKAPLDGDADNVNKRPRVDGLDRSSGDIVPAGSPAPGLNEDYILGSHCHMRLVII